MHVLLQSMLVLLCTAAGPLNSDLEHRIAEEFALSSGSVSYQITVYPAAMPMLGLPDSGGAPIDFSGEYGWELNNRHWTLRIQDDRSGNSTELCCDSGPCCDSGHCYSEHWTTDGGRFRFQGDWDGLSPALLQAVWPYFAISRHLFPITSAQKYGVPYWDGSKEFLSENSTQEHLAGQEVAVRFIHAPGMDTFGVDQDGTMVPISETPEPEAAAALRRQYVPLTEELIFLDEKLMSWQCRIPELLYAPEQPNYHQQMRATRQTWSGHVSLLGTQIPEFCTVECYSRASKDYVKLWTSRIVIDSLRVPMEGALDMSSCIAQSSADVAPFDKRRNRPWYERLWNDAMAWWPG